jgi:hypothetical protein
MITKKTINKTNYKTQSKKNNKIHKKLKIELKSLYDIDEIINLPEFNYVIDIIYFTILMGRLKLKNDKLIIEKYDFQYYSSISENVKKIFIYYYNKFNSFEINQIINDKKTPYYNLLKYTISNDINYEKYIIENEFNIINKNNTLFMFANTEINIKNKKTDLVLLANNTNDLMKFKTTKYDEINTYYNIKNIFPNIIDGQNIDKLDIFFNSLQKTNKKYDNICIENYMLNYDIFFKPYIFLLKLPSIIYLIFNSIKSLNIDGNIHIEISTFNTNIIPIIIKIFCILCKLFKNIKLENPNFSSTIKMLKLEGFIGFNNIYNEALIDDLIILAREYINKTLTTDDIISCLMSNKFYYKLDNELINNLTPYKKTYTKILFDIPDLIFPNEDMNKSYEIIKIITENTKKYLYLNNYFTNKYMINQANILDYFNFLNLRHLEELNFYNVKLQIDYKKQLSYVYNNFIKTIENPRNNILTIKHITSLNISDIYNHNNMDNNMDNNIIDTNLIFSEKYIEKKILDNLINNFRIYYYQTLLLKYNVCTTIDDLNNNLNKQIMNYINGINKQKDIKFEFISLFEILNIYKPIFKKNIVSVLAINYYKLNIELLDAINLLFPWNTILIKHPTILLNSENICENNKNDNYIENYYDYKIRHINDDQITNIIKSLSYYKIIGYSLIIPSINTSICNGLEYYNCEIQQLLYVLGTSCKHSNSITKHKIIIDNLHKINNYNQINLIVDIIYIYSTLYKSIKLHSPYNSNNNTIFYIIGLDYLDNINYDIINKFISIFENPNKNYNILNKNINKILYMKIIQYVTNILENCNNWRYNAYKLCYCKKLKILDCSNLTKEIYFNFNKFYDNELLIQ